jgi:hypothetical protein
VNQRKSIFPITKRPIFSIGRLLPKFYSPNAHNPSTLFLLDGLG